jgi:hypothetical protein
MPVVNTLKHSHTNVRNGDFNGLTASHTCWITAGDLSESPSLPSRQTAQSCYVSSASI